MRSHKYGANQKETPQLFIFARSPPAAEGHEQHEQHAALLLCSSGCEERPAALCRLQPRLTASAHSKLNLKLPIEVNHTSSREQKCF